MPQTGRFSLALLEMIFFACLTERLEGLVDRDDVFVLIIFLSKSEHPLPQSFGPRKLDL